MKELCPQLGMPIIEKNIEAYDVIPQMRRS
jgi:hypothetical protein